VTPTDAERAALVNGLRFNYPGTEPLDEAAALIEQDGIELARLAAENKQLRDWKDDLHAGMYINCVYCGHRYGPDDEVPATMAQALYDHIQQCPEHPLSHASARIAALEAALRELLDAVDDLSVKLVHARPQVFITERLAEATERTRALLPEGKP
jgi:hypothetical protein